MILDRPAASTFSALVLVAPAAADHAEPFDQSRFEAALEAGGPALVEVSAP